MIRREGKLVFVVLAAPPPGMTKQDIREILVSVGDPRIPVDCRIDLLYDALDIFGDWASVPRGVAARRDPVSGSIFYDAILLFEHVLGKATFDTAQAIRVTDRPGYMVYPDRIRRVESICVLDNEDYKATAAIQELEDGEFIEIEY